MTEEHPASSILATLFTSSSHSIGVSFAALSGALLIDFFFKELPLPIHPVVWMGKITNAYKKRFPPIQTRFDLIRSLPLALGLPIFAAGLGFVCSHHVLSQAIALSTTLSFGYFRKVLKNLLVSFRSQNLEAMRNGVGELVSRNTQVLSQEELLGAAVETTIENITDAIIAPLCFYFVGGLPFAMAYRAINTLDAMIGYKDKYFYYGKISARIDDVANFIPSRVVATLLLAIAWSRRRLSKNAWRVFLRDRNKTDSPNAGQTIAAAAAILEVQLSKRDTYNLGDGKQSLTLEVFEESILYLNITTFAFYIFALTYAATLGTWL